MIRIKMKLQTVNILASYFYTVLTFTANVLLFYLTNRPQFSIVYTLIEQMKVQNFAEKLLACGSWFHLSFEHFMMSFGL